MDLETENKAWKIMVGVLVLIVIILLAMVVNFSAKYISLQNDCTQKCEDKLNRVLQQYKEQNPFPVVALNLTTPIFDKFTGEEIGIVD